MAWRSKEAPPEGWEYLLEGREGLGGLFGGPGEIGRSSRWGQ